MSILKTLITISCVCDIANTLSNTNLDQLAENVSAIAETVVDGTIAAAEFAMDFIETKIDEAGL